MSPLDQQLIYRKAKLIEEDLRKLQPYAVLSQKQYLADEGVQLAVERLMERIIGRLIDVNYHLLKETFGMLPVDYYSSFVELGKKKIVPEELARTVAKSVGLRNMLAHEYEAIDQSKVYEAVRDALTQIPLYLGSVLSSVNNKT